MAGEVEEGLSPSVPRGKPTGRLDPVGTRGVEGMGTGHSMPPHSNCCTPGICHCHSIPTNSRLEHSLKATWCP